MNATTAFDSTPPGTSDTRLRERWLLLARAGWIAVAFVIMGLDVYATPVLFHQFHLACAQSNVCVNYQLIPAQLAGFQASGLSLDVYAVYGVAVYSIGALVYAAMAAVIFWRRPDDRMAMLGAYTLLIFGAATVFGALNVLPIGNGTWALPVGLALNMGTLAFYAFFCLFPSGHFAPIWFRWVALAWVLGSLASLVPYPSLQALVGGTLPFVVFFVALICSQVYRYRRISTSVQRQQTKWVVLGFAAGMGGFLAVSGFSNIVLGPGGPTTAPGILLVQTAMAALLCLIPVSIGIAILRSGLWEMDRLINRTLVYGSLTAVLALVYFACVAGFQALAQALTGATSLPAFVIVASTLLIAALFNPLRRRIQRLIDRRFYRRKYDAAKTLAGFSATLRTETDLAHLTEHLVGVVTDTMQPAQVSLWLSTSRSQEAPRDRGA